MIATPPGIRTVILTLCVAGLLAGCNRSYSNPPVAASDHGLTPEKAASIALARWIDAYNAKDPDAMGALMRDGEGFLWIENGAIGYTDAADFLTAFALEGEGTLRAQLLDVQALNANIVYLVADIRLVAELTPGERIAIGGLQSQIWICEPNTTCDHRDWRMSLVHVDRAGMAGAIAP